MKMDRQTLAWINNDKEWMRKTRPSYQQWKGTGGGVSETALLPSTDKPTIGGYSIGGKTYRYRVGDGWGNKKWMHTPQLTPNDCVCPRCRDVGNKWEYLPVQIFEQVVEDYEHGKIDLNLVWQDWLKLLITDYVKLKSLRKHELCNHNTGFCIAGIPYEISKIGGNNNE